MIWKIIMFWLIIMANAKKKKAPEPEEEAEIFDGEIFCKNQSRLIKMERSDEIIIADSFRNNSIQLECKYCEEKENGIPKTWSRQKHIFVGNITEVQGEMRNNASSAAVYITKNHALVFKSLQESDLGLYFCKAPFIDTPDKSFNYLVDLIDKTKEEVRGTFVDLKNYTNFYLKKLNEKLDKKIVSVHDTVVQMKVFTDWTDWSECDSCFRKEGIRYRMGKCRIKPVCYNKKDCFTRKRNIKDLDFSEKQNTEKSISITGEIANPAVVEESIMIFSISLSCRSLLLSKLTPDLYVMTSQIPDFLLSDRCTAPCKGRSLKKGPRYRKSIILAKGAHLTLVCPDSTIDSDIRWEHNRLRLRPNEGADYIPKTDEPRLYVDSFNTLYLFEVTDRESGNYTCFVNGIRMQEVKIIVLTRSLFFTKEFTRHLKYLGFVFLICFVGYLAGITIMCVKSKSENNQNIKKHGPDTERLLKKKRKSIFDSP